MSSMEESVRMSWEDLCWSMFSKEDSLRRACTHFLEADFPHFWERRLMQEWLKKDVVAKSGKEECVRMF